MIHYYEIKGIADQSTINIYLLYIYYTIHYYEIKSIADQSTINIY